MIKLLIRHFIKDYDNKKDVIVRRKYGILVGTIGVFLNILLFIGKFSAGIITSSIAITADSFNNLSDAGSSVVTLVGFKVAGKPADNEHPFGHGRIEYVSGLVVSMVIILMGFELLKTSIDKIIHPVSVKFSILSLIILIISIGVKLWMCYFNRKIGKIINSTVLKATSMDSLSDAIATSAVAIGFVIGHFSGLKLDGYFGIIVALFILYTGYNAGKDTLDELLGIAPDKELVDGIKETVLCHNEIIGIHDLIVHNYGPSRIILSLHAEVPCNMDIMKIHDIIDFIEIELKEKFDCIAVIHMDPIAVDDEKTSELTCVINKIIKAIDESISMHDFRMVDGEIYTNLIFDIVVPFGFRLSDDEIKTKICEDVLKLDDCYKLKIAVDKNCI